MEEAYLHDRAGRVEPGSRKGVRECQRQSESLSVSMSSRAATVESVSERQSVVRGTGLVFKGLPPSGDALSDLQARSRCKRLTFASHLVG